MPFILLHGLEMELSLNDDLSAVDMLIYTRQQAENLQYNTMKYIRNNKQTVILGCSVAIIGAVVLAANYKYGQIQTKLGLAQTELSEQAARTQLQAEANEARVEMQTQMQVSSELQTVKTQVQTLTATNRDLQHKLALHDIVLQESVAYHAMQAKSDECMLDILGKMSTATVSLVSQELSRPTTAVHVVKDTHDSGDNTPGRNTPVNQPVSTACRPTPVKLVHDRAISAEQEVQCTVSTHFADTQTTNCTEESNPRDTIINTEAAARTELVMSVMSDHISSITAAISSLYDLALSTKQDNLRRSASQYAVQINQINEQLATEKAKVETATAALNAATTQHAQAIKAVEERVQASAAEIKTTAEQLAKTQAELRGLKEHMARLTKQHQQISQELETANELVSALVQQAKLFETSPVKSDHTHLSSKVSALTQEKQCLQTQLATVTGHLNEQVRVYNTLCNSIQSMRQQTPVTTSNQDWSIWSTILNLIDPASAAAQAPSRTPQYTLIMSTKPGQPIPPPPTWTPSVQDQQAAFRQAQKQ